MKLTTIIGLVVLSILTAVLLVNFSSNVSTYASFSEAKSTGKEVHIVGRWVKKDKAAYDNVNDVFTFYMEDTNRTVALVKYYDPMPGNFDQAEKIVISGKYENEAFVADKILMKCPSKYNEGGTKEFKAKVNQ